MIELSKESLESFIAEYPTYITWDDGYILEEIKYTHQDKDLNLGKGNMSDSEFDQSNSDAFLSLTPVKM